MGKKSVLITGGAGYIGSILTRHLLERGDSVTCLDNLMYRQQSPMCFLGHPGYAFIQGDARDKRALKPLVEKHDVLLPLAALVGMPVCMRNPREAESINYEAVMMLNGLRSGEQMLIYPTTNSGYGTTTGELHCTEETPLNPISLYGMTKAHVEEELLNSGKDVVTLRLATVFGWSPRMRLDLLVNDFVYKAMSDGYLVLYEPHFKRNFIHIQDVARAFDHAAEHFDSMKGQAYNVGLDDANLSKLELAQRIQQYITKFEIIQKEIGEDPDKRNYIVSNEKIKNTGFSTAHTLDEGIRELIKAYPFLLQNVPNRNA